MAAHNERREARAIIKMCKSLEREIRDSLGDDHLADLSGAIANELSRRYQASSDEVRKFDQRRAAFRERPVAVVD